MRPTPADILSVLDKAAAEDWPSFFHISTHEYHALRMVVLCEADTDDWGIVFETIAGSWIDPDDIKALGVTATIVGPSVPGGSRSLGGKRPIALETTPHDGKDLGLSGVQITGPAGTLTFHPGLVTELDLRPGKVCNLDCTAESPADVLLVRAYLARFPGSLFPPPGEAAALLQGTERDVLFTCDAFTHVLGGMVPFDLANDPAIASVGVLPSASATFRSLAEAIAARDPSRFVPGPSNLDWRLWARFDDENVPRV